MKSYSISQRNKSRGSLVWYGREYEDGLLVKEVSLKTTNKKEAKVWLDLMNSRRFLPESSIKADIASRITVNDAVNAYMDYQSNHVTDATLKNCMSAMRALKSFCVDEGVEKVSGIDRGFADRFYMSMDMKASSKKTFFTIVKTFCGWVIEHYGIEMKNPFIGVKIDKVVKIEKKFWTEDEIDLILDNAKDANARLFMAILAFSGLRWQEAVNFGPSSIEEGFIRTMGKGRKEAFIPVSDRLAAELVKVKLEEGMFSRFDHNERANAMVREAVSSAGLDSTDATCHKFRHSFISNMARNGVAESIVSRIARHNNIQTTMQYYTHFRDEDLKKAINTKKEGT